ncbi:MAG: hypothetical protein Fur0016_21760 [Anaerolineales bacterium]
MKPTSIALGWVLLSLTVALLVPLPIPYYQDFSVLYFSDKALLNRIALYDYPTQLVWVREQTRPDFEFHPYPYPPWYALATLPIALLPIAAAARMWFLVNLMMIGSAVWLLTPHWRVPLRLFGILAAVMFIPAFGLLIVGQYSAPVLLGVALFLWAARRESPWGLAAGLGLMTFKPHIGLFLALAGFGWLVFRRHEAFACQAILRTILLAILLAALGLLADPRWPVTYLNSLMRYRDIPGVQSCGLCASLPVGLIRLLTGQPQTGQAALLSGLLGLGLLGLFAWRFRGKIAGPSLLMCLAVVFTLLVDPYLLNYDYLLLLAPLTLLTTQVRSLSKRVALLTAYLLPWAVLAFGRQGNPLLALSTLLVMALLWQNERPLSMHCEEYTRQMPG